MESYLHTVEDLEHKGERFFFDVMIHFTETFTVGDWYTPNEHEVNVKYFDLESYMYAYDEDDNERLVTDLKEIKEVLNLLDYHDIIISKA